MKPFVQTAHGKKASSVLVDCAHIVNVLVYPINISVRNRSWKISAAVQPPQFFPHRLVTTSIFPQQVSRWSAAQFANTLISGSRIPTPDLIQKLFWPKFDVIATPTTDRIAKFTFSFTQFFLLVVFCGFAGGLEWEEVNSNEQNKDLSPMESTTDWCSTNFDAEWPIVLRAWRNSSLNSGLKQNQPRLRLQPVNCLASTPVLSVHRPWSYTWLTHSPEPDKAFRPSSLSSFQSAWTGAPRWGILPHHHTASVSTSCLPSRTQSSCRWTPDRGTSHCHQSQSQWTRHLCWRHSIAQIYLLCHKHLLFLNRRIIWMSSGCIQQVKLPWTRTGAGTSVPSCTTIGGSSRSSWRFVFVTGVAAKIESVLCQYWICDKVGVSLALSYTHHKRTIRSALFLLRWWRLVGAHKFLEGVYGRLGFWLRNDTSSINTCCCKDRVRINHEHGIEQDRTMSIRLRYKYASSA